MEDSIATLLGRIRALTNRAGGVTLRHYTSPDLTSAAKQDGSPVTIADQEAEQIIVDGLRTLTPDVPVVAEEEVAAGRVPDVSGGRFWLVDPLDGTKEFLGGSGEFTVNIALIEHNLPLLGVVHAPVLGITYAGVAGEGAWRYEQKQPGKPIAARRPPPEGLTVVSSRQHGDRDALAQYLKGSKVASERQIGSSLKLCLLAAGEADVYPRFGRTMEWDIAAGHAVLRAAGGTIETIDGKPLTYGKPDFENPHFVAFGRR